MKKIVEVLRSIREKAIALMEEAAKMENMSGEEKMDYVVNTVNALVDIPVLGEEAEAVLFRAGLELIYQGWKATRKLLDAA